MGTEYFVLHKKDFGGEGLGDNKKRREIYDRRKGFSNLERATLFALKNIHEDPILAKIGITITEGEKMKDPQKPYVIAAYFAHKYQSYCMGEADSVPTHEVVRCSQEQLEATLKEIAKEEPNKIYWGIELKLLP